MAVMVNWFSKESFEMSLAPEGPRVKVIGPELNLESGKVTLRVSSDSPDSDIFIDASTPVRTLVTVSNRFLEQNPRTSFNEQIVRGDHSTTFDLGDNEHEVTFARDKETSRLIRYLAFLHQRNEKI